MLPCIINLENELLDYIVLQFTFTRIQNQNRFDHNKGHISIIKLGTKFYGTR